MMPRRLATPQEPFVEKPPVPSEDNLQFARIPYGFSACANPLGKTESLFSGVLKTR